MKTKEYKAIKNFVHNELGITKEDFSNILRNAVIDEARAFVRRKFQGSPLNYEELVNSIITEEVKKAIIGRQYSTQMDKMYSAIGEVIAKQYVLKTNNVLNEKDS